MLINRIFNRIYRSATFEVPSQLRDELQHVTLMTANCNCGRKVPRMSSILSAFEKIEERTLKM